MELAQFTNGRVRFETNQQGSNSRAFVVTSMVSISLENIILGIDVIQVNCSVLLRRKKNQLQS